MIHRTETEYSSKMEIELDGSKFGTNNGTTNESDRNVSGFVSQRAPSFRSRNLVSKVGHEILETIPPHPAVVFVGLSTQIIYRY